MIYETEVKLHELTWSGRNGPRATIDFVCEEDFEPLKLHRKKSFRLRWELIEDEVIEEQKHSQKKPQTNSQKAFLILNHPNSWEFLSNLEGAEKVQSFEQANTLFLKLMTIESKTELDKPEMQGMFDIFLKSYQEYCMNMGLNETC